MKPFVGETAGTDKTIETGSDHACENRFESDEYSVKYDNADRRWVIEDGCGEKHEDKKVVEAGCGSGGDDDPGIAEHDEESKHHQNMEVHFNHAASEVNEKARKTHAGAADGDRC